MSISTSAKGDLSRVQVSSQHRHANGSSHQQTQAKKRQYSEISASSKARQPRKAPRTRGTYQKGDSDNEKASCHIASSDEEEGGESQDQYEDDFIDDGRQEEKDARKKLQERKGHLSSDNDETFLSVDTPKAKLQQHNDEESDEADPYDNLPATGEKDGGWRYNKQTDEYHLKDWFRLSAQQFNSLFLHQRIGVSWLYNLYQNKQGGVLGDDMGLGKTVQVATLLKGLFDSEQIRKVLIVVPATMKVYWQTELLKWCSDVDNVMQFDDKKKQDRQKQIKTLKKHGGILVTSYGMVTGERINLSEIRFDIVAVDEGHRAKNIQTELRRNLVALRVKGIRLSLSGTPIQNNLSELWSVFDFVQPKIFGSFNYFAQKYTEPIEKGLLKGASKQDQQNSDQLSEKLRAMYKLHFLRRTKDNIFTIRCAETIGRPLKLTELPLKTDLVIWLPLTQIQMKLYQFLIENQEAESLLNDKSAKAAFFILSYIKKLCLHPQLLAATTIEKKRNLGLLSPEEEAVVQAQIQAEQEQQTEWKVRTRRTNKEVNHKQVKQLKALDVKTTPIKDLPVDQEAEGEWSHSTSRANKKKAHQVAQQDTQVKAKAKSLFEKFNLGEVLQQIDQTDQNKDYANSIAFSTKITFLLDLLKNLRAEGHRVLIFSMSKKILNILEAILSEGFLGLDKDGQPVKYMRIDGDTEIVLREQICVHYNKDPSIFCGLLTTKVGGFGLNLTGADRAIILDPDWNPANDNQAVDRVFRIGQKRDVIVYRLLTIGTIEEKIYRRQIYKKGMSLATIDNGGSAQQDFDKYFAGKDLFDLFQYDPKATKCETMELLLQRDGFPIIECPTNDSHIKWLRGNSLVHGISLNSNLYSNNDSQLQVQEPEVFVPIHKKPQVCAVPSSAAPLAQVSKKRLVRYDERQEKSPSTNEDKDMSTPQQISKFVSPLKSAASLQRQESMQSNVPMPMASSSRTQRMVAPAEAPTPRQVVTTKPSEPLNDNDMLFGSSEQAAAQRGNAERGNTFGFKSNDDLFRRFAFNKN